MKLFVKPQHRQTWKALQALSQSARPQLRELLTDSKRIEQWQVSGAGISIDYSRQRVAHEVLQQLLTLADEYQLMAQVEAMFRGDAINTTEQRAYFQLIHQGEHLMGRSPEEAAQALRDSGLDEAEVQRLVPHQSYPCNMPSATIGVDALTPRGMGGLDGFVRAQGVLSGCHLGHSCLRPKGRGVGQENGQRHRSHRGGAFESLNHV